MERNDAGAASLAAPPGGGATIDTRDRPDDLHRLVARTGGLQPWRRAFHAASGLALALLPGLLGLERPAVLAVVGALLAVALGLDLARLRAPGLNRLFFRTFSRLASPREATRWASSTWYLAGALLVLAFLPATAVPGILVLAVADPAASVVGRRWGRVRLGKGSVQGSVAFFLVSGAVLLVATGGDLRAWPAALAATVAELLPLPLDDNLTVPLVAAGALALVGG